MNLEEWKLKMDAATNILIDAAESAHALSELGFELKFDRGSVLAHLDFCHIKTKRALGMMHDEN